MKKHLLLMILICAVARPILAADGVSLDPSRSLFTARPLGMGGVTIGFADDAGGVFTNPSGMTDLEFPQLTGASRKLVMDQTQYTYLSWALPTKWGTFGMGFTGMNTGGSLPTMLDPATNRIIIDPSREAISYDNSVFALCYAKRIGKDLSLGGNLKFFNQSLGGGFNSRAAGTGLDLSATYQFSEWLTAGANLQNLLEANLAWEGGASDRVGGFYKLGGKINILGPTKEALLEHKHRLYGGLDLDIPHGALTATNYHLGAEYFPLEKVALRGGFNIDQNGTGLTLGVGLINGGFRFDYAYLSRPGLPGDAPHYFSLSYVGERVMTVTDKLKQKEPYIRFLEPRDKFVTDRAFVSITAEALARRVMERRRTWTVTAISETFEVQAAIEFEPLNPVYINGIPSEQIGTIESSSPLQMGRNVIEIVGYISPEAQAGTGEVRMLRFKPFSDTPMTYWAIDPIALSVTLGLVTGYPDNSFKPEKGITRAELVTLLVRSMPVRLAETIPYTGFSDVSTKHWAAKYIAYGSYKKLVTGYPDGSFKPNRVLTRAEGVTILARYAQLVEKEPITPPFPDIKYGFWANKFIGPAKEVGMLDYLKGKKFGPSQPFPRSEACEVLYRTPQVQRRVEQFWETGLTSAEAGRAHPPSTQKTTTEAR